MKKSEIQTKLKVIDRWYPDWGIGKVITTSKSRFIVLFNASTDKRKKGFTLTYDFPHAQFLEKATKSNIQKYAPTKK